MRSSGRGAGLIGKSWGTSLCGAGVCLALALASARAADPVDLAASDHGNPLRPFVDVNPLRAAPARSQRNDAVQADESAPRPTNDLELAAGTPSAFKADAFAPYRFDSPRTNFDVVRAGLLDPADNPPEPDKRKTVDDLTKPNPSSPNGQQKIGIAPEDNGELFLRSETVLLKPGQWELDYGFEYVWEEQTGIVQLNDGSITLQRIRDRQYFVPMAIRYGWTENLQPFVNIPWGGTSFERSDALSEDGVSQFGLGDVTAGINWLCPEKHCGNTDIVLGAAVTAPTGIAPFNTGPNTSSLGSGFWAMTVNANFITAIDPAVWYAGIGYTHEFEAEHIGHLFQPGEQFFYQFGVGYAINDSLTLSSTFRGDFQGEWKQDGVTLPGSSTEPFTLRFAATSTVWSDQICEPFVRIGLNRDAPQVDFGIVWTHRW